MNAGYLPKALVRLAMCGQVQNLFYWDAIRPGPVLPFGGKALPTACHQTLSDRPNLALIKALTIGDGNSITQNQWDVFRKTGTTHLVVISGSHVGLVAGLVYFLVLKLWAWTGLLAWSPQRVAAVAAMLVAVFYAGLAGFSVPTQRSVIMLAIVMLAIILQRNTRPFNTLAVALFAVLAFDPLAVLSAGFWLSFLAVSVIVYAVAGRLGKSGYFLESHKNQLGDLGGIIAVVTVLFSTGFPDFAIG